MSRHSGTNSVKPVPLITDKTQTSISKSDNILDKTQTTNSNVAEISDKTKTESIKSAEISNEITKSGSQDGRPAVDLVAPLVSKNMILATIGGKRTRCLVDTGATISCASLAFLRKTNLDISALKQSSIGGIRGVGNEHHDILGTLEIPFVISGVRIHFTFHILEQLNHPLIIGIDFLTIHNAAWDIPAGKLYLQDKLICASLMPSKTGYLRTNKPIVIPSQSEVNIEGKVSHHKTGEVLLIEPISSLTNRSIAGARCLVQVKGGKAPIRLLNPTSHDIHIPRRKVIATVSEIDKDMLHTLDNETVPKASDSVSAINKTTANLKPSRAHNDGNSATSDIKFNIENKSLTVDERSELLSFLKQNEDVFSTSLQDLGRTDLYHHRVETLPNAPPVHMPFYRQTAQNREITHNLVEDMLQQGIIEQSN